jgi:hypothetical protein
MIYALELFVNFGLDCYNLTKVFKGKPFIRTDFKFIDVNENCSFSFFNTIVLQSLYTAAELERHEVRTRTKPYHGCLLDIQHPVLVQPVIWLYQKAIIQNLEFIADSEPY